MNKSPNNIGPLVSIVCSVYNNEDFLREAIDSVLDQSYTQFEFLIVDDCSTDKSADIICSYQDERIQYLKNNENIGLTKSLNATLNIAKGKYIARFDGDDICMKERLQEQVSFMEANPHIDLIGSDVIYINEKGEKILDGNTLSDHDSIVKKIEKRNMFFHPSIFFKNAKEFRYREKFKYSQDYDFFLSLILSGKKLGNISKVLLKYRIVPSSISFSKTIEQQLYADLARKLYLEKKSTGKDSYDKVSSEDIRNRAQHQDQPQSVIKALIINSFKLNQFQSTKLYLRQYFQSYGYWNKYSIYYIVIICRLTKPAKRIFNLKEKLVRS